MSRGHPPRQHELAALEVLHAGPQLYGVIRILGRPGHAEHAVKNDPTRL